MFGEFISMNKNPDFKLSDESSQYIIKSIRDEKRRKKMEMFNNPEVLNSCDQFTTDSNKFRIKLQKYFEPKHFRTRSNNSQGLDKQMEHTYHCRSQSFSPRSSEFATSGKAVSESTVSFLIYNMANFKIMQNGEVFTIVLKICYRYCMY